MSIWQQGSRRKPTGGKYHPSMPKKKMHIGKAPTMTRVGEKKVNVTKARGNNVKLKALSLKEVNVFDAKKKKAVKAIIEDVMTNHANRHFVRMDVITKGAVLKTSVGFVKVTNRPGQEGVVNGVPTEYKEEKGGTRLSKTAVEKKKVVKKHIDKKE